MIFSYERPIHISELEGILNYYIPKSFKVELDYSFVDDEYILTGKFVTNNPDKADVLVEFIQQYKLPFMEEELEWFFITGGRWITPEFEIRNVFYPILKHVFGGDWDYFILENGLIVISVKREVY